jgi:hypothetical protein
MYPYMHIYINAHNFCPLPTQKRKPYVKIIIGLFKITFRTYTPHNAKHGVNHENVFLG